MDLWRDEIKEVNITCSISELTDIFKYSVIAT